MDKTESKQERQSNMELLRIVAMLLVLLVHVNYFSLEAPTLTEICTVPLSSFFRMEFEALALVCVNVFVLISGYFGIRPSFKGVAKFLFQIIFFQFVIYSGCVLFGKVDFSWYGLLKNVIPQQRWFIWAYLGLMLASPVLNAFVETVSKKSLEKYLIVFFVLQFVTGWLLVFWNLWKGGYSAASFCGLYLLARYIRLYSPKITMLKRRWYIIGYLSVTTLSAVLVFVVDYVCKNEVVYKFLDIRFLPYTSLQTILGSVCLLLYFSKLSVHSKFINWVASSAFAVYLVHTNGYLLETYKCIAKTIFATYSSITYLAVILAFVFALFIACVLIDKIRLLLWNKLHAGCSNG